MDLFRALKLKYNPVNWAVAEHDYYRKQESYMNTFSQSYNSMEREVTMSDITAAYAILALCNSQPQTAPVDLSISSSRSSMTAPRYHVGRLCSTHLRLGLRFEPNSSTALTVMVCATLRR